ncbi:MAG TPA: threo-3-hydroxy-L-aspartate ammonia-lyase [Pseudomonas sp.]|uniref:threo-3-hydroxy-L-aspartate ammonia-lyase n=1 Tax=Pseudomonas sp. TaxID=306 RepID=UPI000ECA28F7|nr:threo-3-hydroxy-L-aspartate ammonia-lyase [Pseudomonas sp.]HCN62975.1 threo-3-hydroxy-L-aspartate ammonia-lyase [Pseudomonas sp.]
MPITLPTYQTVIDASMRLEGVANVTPVLTSRTLDNDIGAQVFFKCENYQRTGSFKFRGAYNSLAKFTDAQRQGGVVAFSSGNHAQGIALAASLLKIPAIIVMPTDAPAAKVAATKGYGAEVIFYDRYTQDREAIGQALAAERGMTLIPSYDHPDVLAGQGTAAKELFDSVGPLDALFVGLGGGGMLSGTTLSTRALSPDCTLIGVEPQAGNDGQQSFNSGVIVHIDTPDTLADGAQTQHLGQYTFPIILNGVNRIVTVTDEELVWAMKFFAERMKMVVEPTGCLGLAAVRKYKAELQGQRVGVMITGGNIDIEKLGKLLQS